jgi:hypothetical protein
LKSLSIVSTNMVAWQIKIHSSISK